MVSKAAFEILIRHFKGQRGPLYSDEVHLDASLSWLMRAQDLTGSGGIAGFYSLFGGWHDAYPETTGYIIQTFVNHHIQSKDHRFLARAVAMADWEIDIQLSDGSVRGFCLKKGLSNTPLVFDTGQVILGWVSLYRHTRQPKYLQASLKASLWLLENQELNGTWKKHVYRQHCGTYHSRVAWALLQVANETQRDDLRKGALTFLKWVASQQSQSGFFENTGFRPHGQHFTHAIAYTLEGLIGASQEIADSALCENLMGSVLRTCERLFVEYAKSRTMYGEYRPDFTPNATNYVCGTGNAQLAWCFLKAFQYSKDLRYLHTANALIDDVKSMQLLGTGDSNLNGSIPGSQPLWGRYQRWRLVTWAAKFFCDALVEKKTTLSHNVLKSE